VYGLTVLSGGDILNTHGRRITFIFLPLKVLFLRWFFGCK
jgi:hypothetical protein